MFPTSSHIRIKKSDRLRRAWKKQAFSHIATKDPSRPRQDERVLLLRIGDEDLIMWQIDSDMNVDRIL